MKNKPTDIKKDIEQLHALVDGELDSEQSDALLARLDDEPVLRAELCDIHRVKDLLEFAYPLKSSNDQIVGSNKRLGYVTMAASLFALSLGFVGGYLTSGKISPSSQEFASFNSAETKKIANAAVSFNGVESKQQKIIIYLGSSQKEKFNETLNKAESLLTQYKKEGAMVYVVTSAGGIDLLRTSNTESHERIKTMSGLYKNLNFVACNNQIYQLHKQGKPVHLVDEVKVAPSAVQFVVDHLNKGWKYIAI